MAFYTGRQIVTGDEDLERTLAKLADKAADRVARSVMGAGLTVIAKSMRSVAPVGRTGMLKKSIGTRNEKNKRTGIFESKVGVNVGRKPKKRGKFAPHAHLVVLGTKPRQRKRIGGRFAHIMNPNADQLSTGTMPSNQFVKRGFEAARWAAQLKMKQQAEKALEREAKKARSNR